MAYHVSSQLFVGEYVSRKQSRAGSWVFQITNRSILALSFGLKKGGMMEKKILTVDDSTSVRKLVEFTLKSKGFQVVSAEDGQEALELLEKDKFDAIILDINMPRMDGLQFLQKMKPNHAYAAIPVIVLTTEGLEADRDRAMELGATAYIVKPFKPTQLLGLIDEMLTSS
jgi:two-component system chemotaxis response regulator CheY